MRRQRDRLVEVAAMEATGVFRRRLGDALPADLSLPDHRRLTAESSK